MASDVAVWRRDDGDRGHQGFFCLLVCLIPIVVLSSVLRDATDGK